MQLYLFSGGLWVERVAPAFELEKSRAVSTNNNEKVQVGASGARYISNEKVPVQAALL